MWRHGKEAGLIVVLAIHTGVPAGELGGDAHLFSVIYILDLKHFIEG